MINPITPIMLEEQLRALLRRLTKKEQLVQLFARQVLEPYTHPSRHYHGLPSLCAIMGVFRALKPLACKADALELALYFRYATISSLAEDTVEQNSGLLYTYAQRIGVEHTIVHHAIMCLHAGSHPHRLRTQEVTTRAAAEEHVDACLFADSVYAVCGIAAHDYDFYAKQRRLEYHQLSDRRYAQVRGQEIDQLLMFDPFYFSSLVQEHRGARVRSNLLREQQSLAAHRS